MTYRVGIWERAGTTYPSKPPFDPPQRFPELASRSTDIDEENGVFAAVRELLALLGYDAAHIGTPEWNPLGWLVSPGETVFVKPNMIAERNAVADEWVSVITHGAVIRAVLEYIALALRGRGRILLGDSPQTDSRMDLIRERIGIRQIQERFRARGDVEIEFLDLRDEFWPSQDGIVTARERLPGDPAGTALFDLGDASCFAEIDQLGRRYYGAYYDVDATNRHHSGGKHEYKIARSPLLADAFVSIPKLKTHKKVGVTLNLKGLVGINGDKNYLPHYALGSPAEGGDQFPDRSSKSTLENLLVLPAKRLLAGNHPLATRAARMLKPLMYRVFGSGETAVRAGNWWGNDTCWRMSLDLNRALLYGKPDGTLGTRPRRYLSIVDGIVAMEGNGPTGGRPRPSGLLLGGDNPAAVDAVGARLVGFSPAKIPIIARAFDQHTLPIATGSIDDVVLESNDPRYRGPLGGLARSESLRFAPHFAWRGHVEVD